jgi:GT2 family glycosyltransferase
LLGVVLDRFRPAITRERVASWLGVEDGSALHRPATIAVCTRDRPEDLARCLEALARLPDDGQEILVVDSASRDSSARDLAARYPAARYLRAERPGLDRARNLALREARHEIVAFADDDTVPDPGWLRALTGSFADPRTLCVTGLTLPAELDTSAQEWFQRMNGFGRGFACQRFDGSTCDPFYVARVGAGANMALRRSVITAIGPFDEALDAGTPTRSGGDHDMFTRILRAAYCIGYQPKAVSWHRHRREWHELRATVHGYGRGVYAYLTSQFLEGESRAAVVACRWFFSRIWDLGRRVARRPGTVPLALTLASLNGSLSGPFALWRSRSLVRAAP